MSKREVKSKSLNGLSRIMDEKNITPSQLSRLSGYAKTTIIKFKNLETKASERVIKKISDALGIEPSELIRNDNINGEK